MKNIILSQGKIALVDDEDFEILNQYKWYFSHYGYAVRTRLYNGKKTMFWMHREVLNTPKRMKTDHVNGDTLDNRKINLRICTQAQNVLNRNKSFKYSNPYKGVSRHSQNNNWRARIMVNQKEISLGCYETAIEAAKVYNVAAVRIFGDFARLNII